LLNLIVWCGSGEQMSVRSAAPCAEIPLGEGAAPFQPSNLPTFQPSNLPTFQPSNLPTFQPSNLPTFQPPNLPTFLLTLPPIQHQNMDLPWTVNPPRQSELDIRGPARPADERHCQRRPARQVQLPVHKCQ